MGLALFGQAMLGLVRLALAWLDLAKLSWAWQGSTLPEPGLGLVGGIKKNRPGNWGQACKNNLCY